MAFIARTDEYGNELMRVMLPTNPARQPITFGENSMINCSPKSRYDRDMRKWQKEQKMRHKQRLLKHQSFQELERPHLEKSQGKEFHAKYPNHSLDELPQGTMDSKGKSPNLYFYSWLAANNVAQLQVAIDRGLITQPDDQHTFERAMVAQMKYHKWFQSKYRQFRSSESDMSLMPIHRKMQWSQLNVENLGETKDSASNDFRTTSSEKPKRCLPDYERINRLALPRRPLLHKSSGWTNRHKDCLKAVQKLESLNSMTIEAAKEMKALNEQQENNLGQTQKTKLETLKTKLEKENVDEARQNNYPETMLQFKYGTPSMSQREEPKHTHMSKLEILIKELTEDIDRELEASISYCFENERSVKTNNLLQPIYSSIYESISARKTCTSKKVSKGEKEKLDEMHQENVMQSSRVLPMKLKEKSDKIEDTVMDWMPASKMQPALLPEAVSCIDMKSKLKQQANWKFDEQEVHAKPCPTQRHGEQLKSNPTSSGTSHRRLSSIEPQMTVPTYRKKEKTIPWR